MYLFMFSILLLKMHPALLLLCVPGSTCKPSPHSQFDFGAATAWPAN
jgi:hypothetical protein